MRIHPRGLEVEPIQRGLEQEGFAVNKIKRDWNNLVRCPNLHGNREP